MIIIIILIVVVICLLVYASTKPDTINYMRSLDIKSPSERIFNLINDFHNWPAWSPQDKSDSTMSRTFNNINSGLGAASDWISKGKAGSGHIEIIKSQPSLNITVKVDFVKPFHSININEFTLLPLGEMTRVTWQINGSIPYIAKVFSIFINLNKVFGEHLESGLQSLKTLCESEISSRS